MSEVRIKCGSLLSHCFAAVQQLMWLACDCREKEARKYLAQESSLVLPRMKQWYDKESVSSQVFLNLTWERVEGTWKI